MASTPPQGQALAYKGSSIDHGLSADAIEASAVLLDSIISTVCIKRTVWKISHMTLLNVPYDLKTASAKNKRTVSIKRTV